MLQRGLPDFISLEMWPPNSPDLNPVDYSIYSILQKRVYRSWIHDVKELKKCLLREWRLLDHTVITAVIAQWRSRLNACVRVNGGHCEHKFWASDFLLCFVCFIDTGFRKYDRYEHMRSANIVCNVLLLCLTLSHGIVTTQRTCGKKFLPPITLAFSGEVVHEKLWKSVNICKSYGEKSVAPFLCGHGVHMHTVTPLRVYVLVFTRITNVTLSHQMHLHIQNCLLFNEYKYQFIFKLANLFPVTYNALIVYTTTMGHFTFWISPSLSGIAERNRYNWQASRSNYRGYLHVLKIFIIIIIIGNRILNFLDCILIGIFHWENVLNFYGRKNGGHFERRDAINTFINTFILSEILPACAKEYLTAAMYYCQVEVKVRDRIAAVDAVFPSISCSDIISKQYRSRRVGLQMS